MASKRPRKLKSSQRTGSKAARSSRSPVAAPRTAPAKRKKATTAKKSAAPKRATAKRPPARPATATRAPAGADTKSAAVRTAATPRASVVRAPARAELLRQAGAAGIAGRHRMSTAQLRGALTRLPDRPASVSPSSAIGQRPLISASPPPPVTGLPFRYNETELVAMPVDPVLLHVYWELTPEAIAEVRDRLGSEWEGASHVLRAYDIAGLHSDNGDAPSLVQRARHHFDLDVGGDVGSYYVHLWSPEQTLVFEIGWRSRTGRFVAAARSNRVHTPRNSPCGGEERWMTVRDGRIVRTPPDTIPADASGDGLRDRETAPWSATFPAHRGWGGHR